MAAHSHLKHNNIEPQTAGVWSPVIEAGTVAGLVGGVAMALFATTYAAIIGIGFWTPVRAIAETLVGVDTLGATSSVIAGVAIHVLVSMIFGVLFAVVTPRSVPPVPALALGTFAGLCIFVMMTWLVLPIINPSARSHLMWGSAPGTIPVAAAFAMHMIYGAGLSLAPRLTLRFRR
jgi:hypothetical protein